MTLAPPVDAVTLGETRRSLVTALHAGQSITVLGPTGPKTVEALPGHPWVHVHADENGVRPAWFADARRLELNTLLPNRPPVHDAAAHVRDHGGTAVIISELQRHYGACVWRAVAFEPAAPTGAAPPGASAP